MYPTINVGQFVFPTTGLVLIFGAYVCLTAVEKAAARLGLDDQKTYSLALIALLAGFIGARLTFVLQYWPAYQENPFSMLWPLTSGYNAAGGIVIGAIAAFFYGRYKQLPAAATLDALAPGLMIAFIVTSLADFLGGPGYGTLTAVPWGLSQYGVRRHPVQLYEILAAGLALLVWWQLLPRRRYPGQLFLLTITIYSAGRLLLDAFRENTWIDGNGYHLWQLVSFAIMLAGLVLLAVCHERQVRAQLAEQS